jgi:hypothetical protein
MNSAPHQPRRVACFEGNELASFLHDQRAVLKALVSHLDLIESAPIDSLRDEVHDAARTARQAMNNLRVVADLLPETDVRCSDPRAAERLQQLLGVDPYAFEEPWKPKAGGGA